LTTERPGSEHVAGDGDEPLDEFDDAPPLDDEDFLTSVDAMLQHLKELIPMPAEEFARLEEIAHQRAFTVANVADLDLVSDVWEAIDAAVRNGETLEDFRERVGQKLADAWGGEDPSHLETIFRTNVHSAYSAGRAYQNSRVKDTHPYLHYSVVDDDRTSEICEDLIGVTLPQDDPFIATHQPPLHYRCRTDVVAVTEEEAREYGIDEVAPDVEPDEGFGGDPLGEFEPDLSTRPAEVASIYELKLIKETQ
jgi:SPP1 gp7 family putative phage head morphogenesis protein